MFIVFQMHLATGMSYRKASGFFSGKREGAKEYTLAEASLIVEKLSSVTTGVNKYGLIQA